MINIKCSIMISTEESTNYQFSQANQLKINRWENDFRNSVTIIPNPTQSNVLVIFTEYDINVWNVEIQADNRQIIRQIEQKN